MDTALPAAACNHLKALKTRDSPDFADELKRFQEQGWTSRQLAAALDVSHSYISVRINRATGETPPTAFPVPARAKPMTILPVQELPAPMQLDLSGRLTRAIQEHPSERGPDRLAPTASSYFTALAAALAAGWDAHSIGLGIGVHPRSVPRFASRQPSEARQMPKYPPAPPAPAGLAWNARHPTVPPPMVPAADAHRLSELAKKAHHNRGVEDDGGGALSHAIEYTTLLAEWYLRGASRAELQRVTGQGWEALRKRLTRWGYMRSDTD
ncbi:helix-turn-helix transcriptional regulator [Arthrobacter sp. A2-55]|uniref:helix-turn-helix transcriptional regulator n=1 Tax=Arthrobacter sp. A2-55 TaxID=2897337 RepID=UPI0021CD6C60|nr:helix-turn-helix transcriptional regulator [Arthrobacter sp. A2-55]MCU6480162.1 helix-turn-helix domain-containing protein [Arthrobacter sp. A2-55]